jgi:hypothetical protein
MEFRDGDGLILIDDILMRIVNCFRLPDEAIDRS